jgi:hypothetical protein
MHSLLSCQLLQTLGRNKRSYFDDGRIDGGGVIDLPLSEVGPGDEEGGFRPITLVTD